MTLQEQADAILDAAQDAELLTIYQARLRQLARAQAVLWHRATNEQRRAAMACVLLLEKND